MKRKFLLIGTIIASLILPLQGSLGAEDILNRTFIDPSLPEIAPMIYCKFEAQRDCIEKLIVEHQDGTLETAKYVETNLIPFPDSEGQKVVYGDVIFDFHNESKNGSVKRIRISTHVQTPNFATAGKKYGVYWLMLQRQALPGEVISTPGKCDGTTVESCISFPGLDTRDKFHLYFKTSWLKPVSSNSEGLEASFEHQAIAGGIRWKFSGIEFLQPNFEDGDLLRKSITPEGANLRPDRLSPTLYAVIDHAGTDAANSFWDPHCADYGFTTTVINAPLAGQLYWDYSTESLSFNIYAPHLTPFGEINKGSFHARFQQAWLNCRFPGNTLSTATQVTVQVLDENGLPQVALTSTSIKNGIIDIQASGFHFSSPRVVARRSSGSSDSSSNLTAKYGDDWSDSLSKFVEPTPSSSPTNTVMPKITSTTCIKGAVVKKVTGTKPVCPKGFKRSK